MKDQILNVQKHPVKKLVMISVHNVDSKSIGVNVAKSRFEWAFRNHKNPNAIKAFDSGFFGAIFATDVSEWTEERVGPMDIDSAYEERAVIYHHLEQEGWTKLGHDFKKGESIPGVPPRKWSIWKKSKMTNYKKDKFYNMCINFLMGFDLDAHQRAEIADKAYWAAIVNKSTRNLLNTKADVFVWMYNEFNLNGAVLQAAE